MTRLVHDTWLLFGAHMRNSLRNVVWLIVGMFQPVCYLLLFAPLLQNVANVPGFPRGGTYNVFTPGLLIMTAIVGTGLAGFNLILALREGVLERWRVTPASRLALLLSMVLRDVLVLLAQCALLFVAALLLGMRPAGPGLILLLPLIVLIGLTMSAWSYGLTLLLRDQGALAATVNLITIPLILLSGITLPLSLAPATIRDIGDVNPFAYAVNAARALVGGHVAAVAVAQAFAIFAVLAVLSLSWATRSMRRATL